MSSLSSSFANNNVYTSRASTSSIPVGGDMIEGDAEAPTPPISNRGAVVHPNRLPPPLLLPDPATIKARQTTFDGELSRFEVSLPQNGGHRYYNGRDQGGSRSQDSNTDGRNNENTFSRTESPHAIGYSNQNGEEERRGQWRQQQEQQQPHRRRIARFSCATSSPIKTRIVVATTPTGLSVFPYDNGNGNAPTTWKQVSHQQEDERRRKRGDGSAPPKLRLPPALPEPTLALALNNSTVVDYSLLALMGLPIFPSSATTITATATDVTAASPSQSWSAHEHQQYRTDIENSRGLIPPLPMGTPWFIPFFITACDFFKTGIPMKLVYQISRDLVWLLRNQQLPSNRPLRRRRQAWWKRSMFVSPAKLADDVITPQKQQARQRQQVPTLLNGSGVSSSSEAWVIDGIPNYGQTCFLNAVLQALASLKPFVVYVERIVQVTQQQREQQMQMQEVTNDSPGVTNLSEHVWNVLLAINGIDQQHPSNATAASARKRNRNRPVDPRPILKRIGETNKQFRYSGRMEQQDAQELLQALLGVIIHDGHLDTTSSALESTFASCGAPQEPPRRIMTSPPDSPPASPLAMPMSSHEHNQQQFKVLSQQSKDNCQVSQKPILENYSYDADDETLTTVLATATSSTTMTLNLDPASLVDWSPNWSPNWSPTSSTVLEHHCHNSPVIQGSSNGMTMMSSNGGDSVLSLSSLLHRIDAEQRHFAEQQQQQRRETSKQELEASNGRANELENAKPSLPAETQDHLATALRTTATSALRPIATTTSGLTTVEASTVANTTTTTLATSEIAPNTHPLPCSSSEPTAHQREEKKQEEFEITIPFSASEEELDDPDDTATTSTTATNFERHQRMDDSTISSVATSSSIGAADDLSTSNLDQLDKPGPTSPPAPYGNLVNHPEGSNRLPMSMQIMRSISSINPSPLSGWLGSTLRCCNCKHVRPIQNAPFLDIPVIPTSVTTYLARAARQQHHNYTSNSSPKPTPASSPFPTCSLDQCLKDFTSVERVEDVECRNCTIQEQVKELEDEAMLLEGAISSILSKKEDAKHLQADLKKIKLRLSVLQNLDPDDEDDDALWNCLSPESEELNLLFGKNDNRTNCDKKSRPLSRCEAKKCLLLTRCPAILCCHVQRRYFDPSTNRMEKCVQFVEFPLSLDLAPYCAYGPRAHTPWAAGKSNQDQDKHNPLPRESDEQKYPIGGKMLYRLQSIIEHRGNAHGGHYVCYRRDRAGEWFRISDSNVTPISWQEVRKSQAYMLFYEAV